MLEISFRSAGGVLGPGDFRSTETHERRFGAFWAFQETSG